MLFFKWITNYLSNRTQRVRVYEHLSSDRNVSSGVIQGSVLGPIFFAIFVNVVDEEIDNSTIIKYADDIRIYRCFKSDNESQVQNSEMLQRDIDAITKWSLRWGMSFNSSKCCVLHFGRSNIKFRYKLADCELQKKSYERDLGVLFSVNLKFDQYIDEIVAKANRQLGIIVKVFKVKNPKNIVPLYKTFVHNDS